MSDSYSFTNKTNQLYLHILNKYPQYHISPEVYFYFKHSNIIIYILTNY